MNKTTDERPDLATTAFKFGCGILLIPVALFFFFIAWFLMSAVFTK